MLMLMGDTVAVTLRVSTSISDNILHLTNDGENYLHNLCGLRKGCHILKFKKLKLIIFYIFQMFEKAVRGCNGEVFDSSTPVLHTTKMKQGLSLDLRNQVHLLPSRAETWVCCSCLMSTNNTSHTERCDPVTVSETQRAAGLWLGLHFKFNEI